METAVAVLSAPEHARLQSACLFELGAILQAQGDLRGARERLERSLKITKSVLGTEEHPEVATSLHTLATIQEAEGALGEAEVTYRRVLTIEAKCYGTLDQYHSAETLVPLALLLVRMDRRDEGLELLRQAQSTFQRTCPDHPLLARLNQMLGATTTDGDPAMALLTAAIQARKAGAIPGDLVEAFDALRGQGGEAAAFGAVAEAIARGETPWVPDEVAQPRREMLEQVVGLIRAVDLDPHTVLDAVLDVRRRRVPLDPERRADLDVMGQIEAYAPAARYLEALLTAHEVPPVPDDVEEPFASFLSLARARALDDDRSAGGRDGASPPAERAVSRCARRGVVSRGRATQHATHPARSVGDLIPDRWANLYAARAAPAPASRLVNGGARRVPATWLPAAARDRDRSRTPGSRRARRRTPGSTGSGMARRRCRPRSTRRR